MPLGRRSALGDHGDQHGACASLIEADQEVQLALEVPERAQDQARARQRKWHRAAVDDAEQAGQIVGRYAR